MTTDLLEHSEFPQLNAIRRDDALADVLRRHLNPPSLPKGVALERCQIGKIYYRADVGCRFLFSAFFREDSDPQLHSQTYVGRLFRDRSALEVFQAQLGGNLTEPKFGPSVVSIPESTMIAVAFPNDSALPCLKLMADDDRIHKQIERAPERLGLTQAPLSTSGRLAKYVPGHRCAYLYDLTLPSTRGTRSVHLFAKGFARSVEGRRVYAILKQIWETDARRNGEFLLPQPIGYDEENRILWQEALPGRPFSKRIAALDNLPELATEIGSRLAAFHGTRLDLPEETTIDFQRGEIESSLTAIARAYPDRAESCHAVGRKLLAAARGLGDGAVTPLHASFKFSHFFATERGVAFIDFDGANLGDPAFDLGRFIAHLSYLRARTKVEPGCADRTARNFCLSYNSTAVDPVSQQRIDWYASSHIISSQILKTVKRLKPRVVDELIKIADRLCPSPKG